MDLRYSKTDEEFRAELRGWLEKEVPAHGPPPASNDWEQRRSYDTGWQRKLYDAGYAGINWPAEYGGRDASLTEQLVYYEEIARARAPYIGVNFVGILHGGPTLIAEGTPEQKARHVPYILSGEQIWCQGFSEPIAGSDLAALQTRAEKRGDHYLVNGQKIWTSYADKADWIFCLVRTDTQAPKHDGISFLLFDMASPGVTVSPIQLISGSSPFCQTFFQDVKVPKDQLVGEVNGGWTIAKRLLQHERSMIGGMGLGLGGGVARGTPEIAKDYCGEENGRIADPVARDRVAQMQMDARCYGATTRRAAAEAKAGIPPGPASSMFKLYGTEMNKRRHELLVSMMGTQATGWEGEGFTEEELGETRDWLRSFGNSIEGGTSEVQLNIIAKRVLGLPD